MKNGQPMNNMDGAPQLTVKETDYGFVYGSRRDVGDGEYYWRVTQFILPFYSLIPTPETGKVVAAGYPWTTSTSQSSSILLAPMNRLQTSNGI